MNLKKDVQQIEKHSRRFLSALIFFVCVLPSQSFAQIQPDIPASADVSRFEAPRDIFELEESVSPVEDALGRVAYLSAPQGAESIKFNLTNIRIDGLTAFSENEIRDLYEDMLGREVSVADIYNVANDIIAKYRDAGYVLARVSLPPQEIEDGVVELSVTQGFVQDIKVEGEVENPSFIVRGILARIKNDAFNSKMLERNLLLLNRVTGLNAVGVLKPVSDPSKAAPGAVDLVVILQPKEIRFTGVVDNYGSNYIGPFQAGVAALMPHTGRIDGVTEASVFITPQTEELGYVSLSEKIPVLSNGLTIEAGVIYSRSEPGGSLNEIDLRSYYKSFHLETEYPVYLARDRSLDVYGRLEINNAYSKFLAARFYDDRLRVFRTGLRGEYAGIFNGVTSAGAEFSQGLDILGARQSGSEDLSRAQGRSDFSKLEARFAQTIPFARGFGLSTQLSGQYAFAPLLSSEEFGYGGYALGRAYSPSEITGDSGFGILAETGYYGMSKYEGKRLKPGFVPFVFYDFGKVWNRDDDTNPESGASAGVGFSLNWGEDASLRFTVAQPLSRSVENPSYGNGKNPKFLVSFQSEF